MATKKTSKTAKKSVAAAAPQKPKGAVELSPDMDRLVPTGVETRFAYVMDVDGKSIHSPVGSDRFYQAISTLIGTNVALRVAKQAERLDVQYPGIGWAKAAGLLRGTWTDDAAGDGGTPESV